MIFRRKKAKDDFEDDGRTVADMYVDGMPWYNSESRTGGKGDGENIELTPAENRAFTGGVLKAVLLTVSVFAAVYFFFILFCVKVWFK